MPNSDRATRLAPTDHTNVVRSTGLVAIRRDLHDIMSRTLVATKQCVVALIAHSENLRLFFADTQLIATFVA
jgi:hypothetical protein